MTVHIHADLISTPPDPPLTHARIGYDQLITPSGVTGIDELPDGEAVHAAYPSTFDVWEPSSVPAWWRWDAGQNVTADYCGIAAHTLGSIGRTIVLRTSADGSNYTDVHYIVTPSTDEPIMILFPATTARYWDLKMTIDGSNTSGSPGAAIGVVYLGQALAMQRAIYSGHSPINLARRTTVLPSRSVSGQFVGRSVIREGLEASFDWRNLEPQWYRDNFDPFVAAARERPFFIAWRPLDWSEAAYGEVEGDVSPVNSGARGLMDVGFTMRGFTAT